MRTVSEITLDGGNLITKSGRVVDSAALDLLKTLLREERVMDPEDSPVVTVDQILLAFEELEKRSTGDDDGLPTDPTSRRIAEASEAALGHYMADSQNQLESGLSHLEIVRLERRLFALREALALLAQIPVEKAPYSRMNLRELIFDRDNEVFGLLFQQGLRFIIRLRHDDQVTLKAATQKIMSACAPRTGQQMQRCIQNTPSIDGLNGKLSVDYAPIELRTPSGSLSQMGQVHVVKSQLGLLWFLARQTPQVYLVVLTVILAALDLAFKLRTALPVGWDWTLRGVSLGDWLADFEGRLSTGAFGAYLVTLFIRYGEIRDSLRGPGAERRRRRRSTYGAIIEWKTA